MCTRTKKTYFSYGFSEYLIYLIVIICRCSGDRNTYTLSISFTVIKTLVINYEQMDSIATVIGFRGLPTISAISAKRGILIHYAVSGCRFDPSDGQIIVWWIWMLVLESLSVYYNIVIYKCMSIRCLEPIVRTSFA